MITACITFRASHLCILSVKKRKKKKTLLGEEVKKESETKLFSHVRMKIALESDFSWRLIGSSVLLCVSASICVCVCVCVWLLASTVLCMCQTGVPPAPVWKMISWGATGSTGEPKPTSNKHVRIRALTR